MKKTTSFILCAFLLTFFPTASLSAGTVMAKDTVAGIGTEITLQGFAPNEALSLSVLPPLGPSVPLAVTADTQGNAAVRMNGEDTQTAGTYRVQLQGSAVQMSFSVTPDAIDTKGSSIEVSRSSVTPDGQDAVNVTVILRDRYVNPLAGRPVELISSRTEDRVQAKSAETDRDGQQVFVITTQKTGAIELRAIDLLSGKLLDAHATITAGQSNTPAGGNDWFSGSNSTNLAPVGEYRGRPLYAQLTDGGSAETFSAVDHFAVVIDGSPSTVTARQDMNFRVTALDANGQIVEDYAGSIRFSSTDPKAILPFGTRQFAARDLGTKTFTLGLRFVTAGEQTLAVEDSTGKVAGHITVQVGGSGETPADGTLTILDPGEGSTVNSRTVQLKGTGPALINLIVTGGKDIVHGDTNAKGEFQISVPLQPSTSGATLRVEEATGKFQSDPRSFLIDTTPPRIVSVDFSPKDPVEGQTVHVTVQSEPLLPTVTVSVDGTVSPLTEDVTHPGTYQGSFTATKIGTLQPLIEATDAYGNKAQMLTNLATKAKAPPTVEKLTAQAKVNAVALSWQPLAAGEADGYRVYVGTSAQSFDYSLDTGEAVSAATVAGLKPATAYFFAVTALKNNVESLKKSETASVTVLGLKLTASPGDGNLLLEWTPMKKETALAAFLLEYGTEPDQLTEKRMVNGEAQSYTLNDLINGITYFCRITPITTTGDQLKDLMATAQGTPNGRGFRVVESGSTLHGSGFDQPYVPPAQPTTTVVADTLPSNGIGTWAWWSVSGILAALLLFLWKRKKTMRVMEGFMETMERKYRLLQ
ncbi:MAG: Ig-like domain-containing protein [Candidatus Peregrinibacteria bacterium]